MLALQRSAGNHAVSAMLGRQPAGTAGAEAEPMKDEKGATATLGLGEDQVIPIDSYSWRLADNEVAVMFGLNAASAELAAAAAKGKHYATAFISSWTMMARMTDVLITSYSTGDGSDGGGEMTTLELNFKSVKHEPVGK